MERETRTARIVRVAFRVLAGLEIGASVPFAMLAYSALPSKIRELRSFYPEPYPWGSESYLADRHRIWLGLVVDMVLYVLASASLFGLASIAAGAFSRRGQAFFWAVAAITGAGIALHLRPTIGPTTAGEWVAMVFVIPLATSIVSCMGFLHALVATRTDGWD